MAYDDWAPQVPLQLRRGPVPSPAVGHIVMYAQDRMPDLPPPPRYVLEVMGQSVLALHPNDQFDELRFMFDVCYVGSGIPVRSALYVWTVCGPFIQISVDRGSSVLRRGPNHRYFGLFPTWWPSSLFSFRDDRYSRSKREAETYRSEVVI